MQNQNPIPPKRIVSHVTCIRCNRPMILLHNTDTQSVYGDTAGHIRKLPRSGGQRIPVTGPTKPAA